MTDSATSSEGQIFLPSTAFPTSTSAPMHAQLVHEHDQTLSQDQFHIPYLLDASGGYNYGWMPAHNQSVAEISDQTQGRDSVLRVKSSSTVTGQPFMEVLSQLSQVLFDLRRDHDSLFRGTTPLSLGEPSTHLQQIFQRVMTFIDISRSARYPLAAPVSEGLMTQIQSLTHLSLIAISCVMGMYFLLLPGDERLPANSFVSDRSHTQAHQQNETEEAFSPSRLTTLLNLTTMEFHIVHFQSLFAGLATHSVAANPGISDELQRVQEQARRLRTIIHVSIEHLMAIPLW